MAKNNFDNEKVSEFVMNFLETQKKGPVSDYFETIQPNLDKMNLDADSKKQLIEILFQLIGLNTQMTSHFITEFLDSVYTQLNPDSE